MRCSDGDNDGDGDSDISFINNCINGDCYDMVLIDSDAIYHIINIVIMMMMVMIVMV